MAGYPASSCDAVLGTEKIFLHALFGFNGGYDRDPCGTGKTATGIAAHHILGVLKKFIAALEQDISNIVEVRFSAGASLTTNAISPARISRAPSSHCACLGSDRFTMPVSDHQHIFTGGQMVWVDIIQRIERGAEGVRNLCNLERV